MGFGIDINVRSKDGRTLLHEAAENGHLEIVRLLAGHHAYVDATTYRSNTPMLLALENCNTKVIELSASEFAANVNVKSKYGWTLLHHLARDGNETAHGLLADRKTAGHHCTKSRKTDIWRFVRLLAGHHAYVDATTHRSTR